MPKTKDGGFVIDDSPEAYGLEDIKKLRDEEKTKKPEPKEPPKSSK
jgi:sugar phosphate permease